MSRALVHPRDYVAHPMLTGTDVTWWLSEEKRHRITRQAQDQRDLDVRDIRLVNLQ